MGEQRYKAERFGFDAIVAALAELQTERGLEAMDREASLARLVTLLGAEEELLLQKGFDRAYRQIVEGV